MSLSNQKIRYLDDKVKYCSYPYGRYAGKPTVQVALSKSDANEHELRELDQVMGRYGWKSKVKSGFSRMRIKGSRPLDDLHIESLSAVNDMFDPRFLDIELSGKDINTEPSRIVDTFTDFYSLVIDPKNPKYDEDALEYYSEKSRKYDGCEFIFKVRSFTDEDRINRISRQNKIYDSDIWLLPVGRKMESVAENTDKCIQLAKRNTWNVSPKHNIVQQYYERLEEDDE